MNEPFLLFGFCGISHHAVELGWIRIWYTFLPILIINREPSWMTHFYFW